MADNGAENVQGREFDPKVKWIIPQKLNSITFIGKDVIAVAHEIYITFMNVRTNSELVYTANCKARGDGVDVVAGHRTQVFAFAEKVNEARIFIVMYPSFNIIAELKEPTVNRYKAVHMMEGDLVCGFSGFPNFVFAVWNWRSSHHLITVPTNVLRRNQSYTVSRTHSWACQCWGDGMVVWEVAPCFRRCMVMRRDSPPPETPPRSHPPPELVSLAWSVDGGLYGVDAEAHLYCVVSDGINMQTTLEWDEEVRGSNEPHMAALGGGFLVYGPDDNLRWLMQEEKAWVVRWSAEVPRGEVAERLLTNAAADAGLLWTRSGYVYRIIPPDDHNPHPELSFYTFKQRFIVKIDMIAPNFTYVVTLSSSGIICVYDSASGRPVVVQTVCGEDVTLAASPVRPVLAVTAQLAATEENRLAERSYGVALLRWQPAEPDESGTFPDGVGSLEKVSALCLTRQIVSRAVFSPDGRFLMVAAMSAGHVFILRVEEDLRLTLVRQAEMGRGLADCTLMPVGGVMRAFSLVLVSDKYSIGERIVCINAETGKDNKFAGKMQGPYARLIPLGDKDTMLALPHQVKQFHRLKLGADRGVTVSVRVEAVVESGHEVRWLGAHCTPAALYTYGMDGALIMRPPHGPRLYEWRLVAAHRYEGGVVQVAADACDAQLVTLSAPGVLALTHRNAHVARDAAPVPLPTIEMLDTPALAIVRETDKNLEQLEEEALVRQEAAECRARRDELMGTFRGLRAQLVELLEENIAERPLHQLSLSEFNLHMEAKKERLKQAEKEREEIRVDTEALIRAQDKVTAWIKSVCWDSMASPRVKLFAIFSHYHVENYAVLGQRNLAAQAQAARAVALRAIEMENDEDLFHTTKLTDTVTEATQKKEETAVAEPVEGEGAVAAGAGAGAGAGAEAEAGDVGAERSGEDVSEAPTTNLLPDRLAGPLSASSAHRFVTVPAYWVPQTRTYSFLHMDNLQHFLKFNVQNMRLWFNERFDELMAYKRREVGLVMERNARLRFIIEELNKLSDLRGSFHHLIIPIKDPEWRQEEEPQKLIKVEPEECTIPPYISPSQIVIPPPELGPKDDFRERALIEMMDGVLEKLWHEEIKKPIPMPQCMLDKDPEKFTEEDLKQVFEYERKVEFRNSERDKYRKMLHAEYAQLARLTDEGIVKFNAKVKEIWLTKLRVDSVIGQENLALMRLRRINLDRIESAELVEAIRAEAAALESQLELLQHELSVIQEQANDCQHVYDTLAHRDRLLDRTFKTHFTDVSQMVVDICYKFFRKRPKWHQRATMTPSVLNEMASAIQTGVRPLLLHADCQDYVKALEQLDQITNMPPVLDEYHWNIVCRLRRAKVENEIRMRALVEEAGLADAAEGTWGRGAAARRQRAAAVAARLQLLRRQGERAVRNVPLQLVLPAGQVEISTTGHMPDFEDAVLLPREDIEKINNLILRVGAIKLAMMRKQMEFRKVILAKEWEHAQMKMKLRHMREELYSYTRLKIPKELQLFLKNKEKGYTDETDYQLMEKEMAATKMSFERAVAEYMTRVEDAAARLERAREARGRVELALSKLTVSVSDRRLRRDPAGEARARRLLAQRMRTLVARGRLVRAVQCNHATVLLLETELELLRLRTFPTLTRCDKP